MCDSLQYRLKRSSTTADGTSGGGTGGTSGGLDRSAGASSKVIGNTIATSRKYGRESDDSASVPRCGCNPGL